jgi:hypothetical protein
LHWKKSRIIAGGPALMFAWLWSNCVRLVWQSATSVHDSSQRLVPRMLVALRRKKKVWG